MSTWNSVPWITPASACASRKIYNLDIPIRLCDRTMYRICHLCNILSSTNPAFPQFFDTELGI